MVFAGCKKDNGSAGSGGGTTGNQTDTSSIVKGADISWLTQMESSGYLFYDSAGLRWIA